MTLLANASFTEGDASVEIAKIRQVPGDGAVPGLKDQLQQGLWNDILSQTASTSAPKGKAAARKRKERLSDTEDEEEFAIFNRSHPADGDEALSSKPGPKSFISRMRGDRAVTSEAASSSAGLGTSMQAVAGPSTVGQPSAAIHDPTLAGSATLDESPLSSQVFSGLRFRTFGQASHDTLVSMVRRNGGNAIRSRPGDDCDDADFAIVRLHE